MGLSSNRWPFVEAFDISDETTTKFRDAVGFEDNWNLLAKSEHCASQSQLNLGLADVRVDFSAPSIVESESSGCSKWSDHFNANAIQVEFSDYDETLCKSSYVTYEGTRYNLWQLEFHSPSQHKLSGSSYNAEVHLIHKSTTTDDILTLATLLQVDDNMALNPNKTLIYRLLSHSIAPAGGLIPDPDAILFLGPCSQVILYIFWLTH
jgi:carbonic anhydrase